MNGKGDRNRSNQKTFSENWEKIFGDYSLRIWATENVASCKGLCCPIADKCIHYVSKNKTDNLLSPFNYIDGACSEFISKDAIVIFLYKIN